MYQVAKDEELLETVKDYFKFVTKFFEVINVSARHIYHSALELCPTSSIIRKLYYHRRVTQFPKVVVGTPDSWDSNIAIFGERRYGGPCTWSPCGQFVAAQTRGGVEIRNQLTLEPTAILQHTEIIPRLTDLLAYSLDGRSIACTSDTAIVIWDVQTGGVVERLTCNTKCISLVWSPDGQTLCAIEAGDQGTFVVHTYDVSSGTTLTSSSFQSGDDPHLWMHDGSFRVMATVRDGYDNRAIDIFEVGSPLIKIQSFVLPRMKGILGSFSPTTYRISILNCNRLCILDIRNSKSLFETTPHSTSHCFSSDGSLFAVPLEGHVHVWKYTSDCYTLLRKFRCQGFFKSLRFSPTPSSILGCSSDGLQVWRLHEPSAAPSGRGQRFVGLSRSGARVATACIQENTITIVDVLAQTPPQFIDVGTEIKGLVITGNVLLVRGPLEVVAWLLTEEGLVDGVIGGRRVDRGDSIWTVPASCALWVGGHVGVIKLSWSDLLHVYHTETGEILDSTQIPRHSTDRRHSLFDLHRGRDYLDYHNLSRCDILPEESWKLSPATLGEGWVKDPEGKRRLWVPHEWRKDWDSADWLHDFTIQFSLIEGKHVLVKF